MRNLFSKGLMAAAAVMMFASCSNEEGNVPAVDAKTTDVTIGLSVAPSTRSSADDVNLGETKVDISNVAVVPMVGTAPQKPVRWDAVDANGKSEEKTAQLLSSVNGFRVYGNLTAEQYAATENVLALDDEMFKLQQSKKNTAYKAPHSQLYYYRDVQKNEFWTSSTGDTWAGVKDWTLSETVGTAKYVKVDGINYVVGVLAAAVLNGDNTQCFLNAEGVKTDAKGAGVTVSGIIVNNQKDFTSTFGVGDPHDVYEDAVNGTFATEKIADQGGARERGNIFMIAAPTTADEQVNVNIEFLLPAGSTLTKTDGTKVIGAEGTGTKLYLGLKLKGNGQATVEGQRINSVFAADYVTYLNATVKNWGIATETPVEVTDAEIGVEFDVTWQEGNIYDVEI